MLIVFDLDGTLSNSRGAIVATFQEACLAHGFAEPAEAEIAGRIGLPLARMFRELAPGGDVDGLIETYRAAYLAHDAVHTRLFPGIPELVRDLDGTLALATSKTTAGAEHNLRRLGLRPHFTVVLGHDAVERGKPEPDMLLEVMRRAGRGPGETVMVGDTTFDLEMADAAGVRGLGVAWGSHGAEGLARWPVARDTAELGRLLARSGF